jgi:hypothetical protein
LFSEIPDSLALKKQRERLAMTARQALRVDLPAQRQVRRPVGVGQGLVEVGQAPVWVEVGAQAFP